MNFDVYMNKDDKKYDASCMYFFNSKNICYFCFCLKNVIMKLLLYF